MLLLLLDLAAWCFAPGRDACVGRAYFNLPMGQQRSLINDAAILFPLAAAFVVSVVMLRLFYLSEGTFKEAASRPQKLRLARFLGRCAVTWALVATPPVILDMGYMHASWFLYPRHLHGVVAILSSYVGIKAVGLLSGSYLHARLILYVPAGIFQKQPETFRTAFHRTSASRWGLLARSLSSISLAFFPNSSSVTLRRLQSILACWYKSCPSGRISMSNSLQRFYPLRSSTPWWFPSPGFGPPASRSLPTGKS